MKYYCATEVKYLETIVNPLGRKPTVYTKTRRNNVPITTIRENTLSGIREPDVGDNGYVWDEGFTKEEALKLALEIKNQRYCWNCTICEMIKITEDEE